MSSRYASACFVPTIRYAKSRSSRAMPPAANVDADGVGHDRLLRLERAADRRAEAEVGIRHKREVALDDRQPANALGLPHRRLVDYRRPGLDGSLSVFVFGLDGFNHGA